MARVIVLWCPDWPIVAARSDVAPGEDLSGPLALSHGHYITACSVEAQAEGVRVGQRLREAQATSPRLHLLPEKPERDWRIFTRVLHHLADTVAMVSVVEPGMVVCQARGLARYYGSENAAAEALRHAVATSPVPLAARVGIANSLFAAQQAAILATSEAEPVCVVEAGVDQEFLAPLPVSVLGDSHLATLLSALGIHTLAEFAEMDSGSVSERFGPHGALLQQWAQGEDPRHLASHAVPAGTDVVWRTDEPMVQLDALSFALLAPATQFIDTLASHHAVCTTVRITMLDERGHALSRVWSHPRYFTASDLVNRVGWQWEARGPGGESEEYSGIVEVVFQAVTPDDIADHEPALWGFAPANSRVEHAVAQLQSQLGYHAVKRAHTRQGRDLSETDSAVAWGEAVTEAHAQEEPWPGALPKPLPATVFTPPIPTALTDVTGAVVELDGVALQAEPAQMMFAGASRPVSAWAGPWPVMERWWDGEHARNRYRLQLLDTEGVGWLVSQLADSLQWVVEARYD